MSSVSAIIVAAGSGSRMGENVNKQLLILNEMPVFMYSVIAFSKVAEVCEIIIVAKMQDIECMKKIVSEYNIVKPVKFVIGGKDRQGSVLNGFKAANNTDYIAIHDGARPLIAVRDIENVIAKAKQCGGATLGVSVKDTIKVVDALMNIVSTPERSTLYSIQTPQVFKSSSYSLGCEYAATKHCSFTDDCQLCEAVGLPVEVVSGSYENIKITTPEDIFLAQRIISSRAKGR